MGGVGLAHRLSERQAGDEDGGFRHISEDRYIAGNCSKGTGEIRLDISFYAL